MAAGPIEVHTGRPAARRIWSRRRSEKAAMFTRSQALVRRRASASGATAASILGSMLKRASGKASSSASMVEMASPSGPTLAWRTSAHGRSSRRPSRSVTRSSTSSALAPSRPSRRIPAKPRVVGASAGTSKNRWTRLSSSTSVARKNGVWHSTTCSMRPRWPARCSGRGGTLREYSSSAWRRRSFGAPAKRSTMRRSFGGVAVLDSLMPRYRNRADPTRRLLEEAPMPVENDPSPELTEYAHPEKLVTADWLAAHLDDPDVVIVESDEDVLLYDTGHIPGADSVHWQPAANDHGTCKYVHGQHATYHSSTKRST